MVKGDLFPSLSLLFLCHPHFSCCLPIPVSGFSFFLSPLFSSLREDKVWGFGSVASSLSHCGAFPVWGFGLGGGFGLCLLNRLVGTGDWCVLRLQGA